jgi:hypothetical protein
VTDDVLSDIVSTSVLILINTYYKADPLTSKPGLTGCIVQPRRSRMKPSTSCGDGWARALFVEADSRLYLDSLLFLEAEDLFRLLSCRQDRILSHRTKFCNYQVSFNHCKLSEGARSSLEEARSDPRRCKIPTPESSCHIGVAVLAPGSKGTNP